MAAGADMAAVSMHKSGGSLTQSSILLCGPGVNAGYVGNIINLTQTTSGSYLLMASLDISRRNLAMRGEKSFARVVDMAEYARREINAIGGYYAYGSELKNGGSVYDFDVTKLAVNTRGIGLTGIEVYDLLRDEYDTQVEFGIGPMIMMKFVCKLTKELNIPTVVSLNPIMVDGTGMCGACRVTVGDEVKFACVDGPEFDGHKVNFDEAMKRQQIYKTQEGRAYLKAKEGATHHGGCGNCAD